MTYFDSAPLYNFQASSTYFQPSHTEIQYFQDTQTYLLLQEMNFQKSGKITLKK